jgi:hypothetical protein
MVCERKVEIWLTEMEMAGFNAVVEISIGVSTEQRDSC